MLLFFPGGAAATVPQPKRPAVTYTLLPRLPSIPPPGTPNHVRRRRDRHGEHPRPPPPPPPPPQPQQRQQPVIVRSNPSPTRGLFSETALISPPFRRRWRRQRQRRFCPVVGSGGCGIVLVAVAAGAGARCPQSPPPPAGERGTPLPPRAGGGRGGRGGGDARRCPGWRWTGEAAPPPVGVDAGGDGAPGQGEFFFLLLVSRGSAVQSTCFIIFN